MMKILQHYVISEDLVNAINTLYINTKSSVIVDGMLSEDFEVDTWVLQGDVLAPFLFINNIEIENVKDFCYLGSYIAFSEHDLKCRKGLECFLDAEVDLELTPEHQDRPLQVVCVECPPVRLRNVGAE